jgi:hypothetical protein
VAAVSSVSIPANRAVRTIDAAASIVTRPVRLATPYSRPN